MKRKKINPTYENWAKHLPPWGEAGGGCLLPSAESASAGRGMVGVPKGDDITVPNARGIGRVDAVNS
jgi:hypothetical protein